MPTIHRLAMWIGAHGSHSSILFLVSSIMELFKKTKGILAILILVVPLFCTSSVCDADGFDSVRCGSDIRTALVGRKMSNERIVVLQERHKDLGLKNLGGTEISDRLFSTSWQICGEEYVVLEDQNNVARDVLKFPKHSKDAPEFIGSCQLNWHDLPGTAIGVLKNEDGKFLPAMIAWKIDDKQVKFVKLQTEGLRCSRDGIITSDGGL